MGGYIGLAAGESCASVALQRLTSCKELSAARLCDSVRLYTPASLVRRSVRGGLCGNNTTNFSDGIDTFDYWRNK